MCDRGSYDRAHKGNEEVVQNGVYNVNIGINCYSSCYIVSGERAVGSLLFWPLLSFVSFGTGLRGLVRAKATPLIRIKMGRATIAFFISFAARKWSGKMEAFFFCLI